jgi:TRAP-type uncharacterized transport system substrate-binding protein
VLAESSAKILNANGLQIEVIHTEGAIDNVTRLEDPKDRANAAFTYGAALEGDEIAGIYSLGSIGYEPIWILYNKNKIREIKSLNELARYKVGLGPTKSGSYRIAKMMLKIVNININDNPNFKPDSMIANQAKLKSGELDALVFISTIQDPITQDLLKSPNIAIFDFKNAPAFAKQFNSFVTLTLPADSISINRQIPQKDVTLLATSTSLVVKRSMHPDLQLAILMSARDSNRSSPDLFFAGRGEFPAYLDASIPISPVAEHFYDYGPPHAMRYLPYWLAGLMDRAWLLFLTIFAIFYPLSKLNARFRKFRFTLKTIPHYKELLKIERKLQNEKLSTLEKQQMLERLDVINTSVVRNEVPIGEESAYFFFLNAISLLKRKIQNT